MYPTRGERPTQLYLDLGRWSVSVMSIAVTVVFVVVVGLLANSVRKNNDRAEDWRRRAVAAEEIVGGLRVVIGERSTALNQRTRQANALVSTLATSRGALRDSKGDLGALTRRQRQLASDKAAADAERRRLEAQRTALLQAASALSACSEDLGNLVAAARRAKPKQVLAAARPQLAQCSRARARYASIVESG